MIFLNHLINVWSDLRSWVRAAPSELQWLRLSGTTMAVLLLFLCAPARADDGVFRHFVWGVSEADVMKFETATFYKKEGDSLFFLEQPDRFRRLITYDFKGGKLWRARFEYVELHDPDPQKIIDLYDGEERALEKKFGRPVSEDLLWTDRTYRNYPQFWGRALLSGNLKFRTRWQTQGTDIELQTYNGEDFYQIFYVMQKSQGKDLTQSNDILNFQQKSR